MDMREYAGSNLYNAEKIPPDTLIEEVIIDVVLRDFDDGRKPVLRFESGMALPLTPTKTQPARPRTTTGSLTAW
jgi:hypothetical protein